MSISSSEILSVTISSSQGSYSIGYRSIEYLHFTEDIFCLSVTGKLRFMDTAGVVEKLPICCNETVTIKYGNSDTKKVTKTLTMVVYKINKIEQSQLNDPTARNVVELTLVDTNFKNWSFNTWSKAWTDTNIGDIIEDICDNFLDITEFHNFDKTKEYLPHFDTHNRTAAECVEWLMKRSSDMKFGSPGYLLYNTHLGKDEYKLNFVTIESLLSSTKMMEPKGDNYIYQFESTNVNYVNKIKHHKMNRIDYNALRTISGGKVLGYDIMRKKLINQEFNYKDAIKKFTILGNYTLFPEDVTVLASELDIDGYCNEDIIDNLWYGNWIKEYCVQQTLDILVLGNENRHAGGMIQIHWPSIDVDKKMFHDQFRGKYLVKSVTNMFGDEWMQKLCLIKNGYNSSPDTSLMKASKTNISQEM